MRESQDQSARYVEQIQYLRGIAAVMVLLSHSAHYFQQRGGSGVWTMVFPAEFGLFGVAIFFAISGYLMATLLPVQSPPQFLLRRVVRIYPLFLLSTAIGYALASDRARELWHPISLMLAPNDLGGYILAIEWTLVHEMFFYCCLFLISLFAFSRFLFQIALIWLILLAVVAGIGVKLPAIGKAELSLIGLMGANAGFAGGLLIPSTIRYLSSSGIYLGLAIVLVAVTLIVPAGWVRLCSGLSGAALVAAAVCTRQWHLPKIVSMILRYLGDWSYALYLIHVTVLIAYFRLVATLEQLPGRHLFFAIALALAVAAILGQVDRLANLKTRRWVAGQGGAKAAVLSGVFFLAWVFAAFLDLFPKSGQISALFTTFFTN